MAVDTTPFVTSEQNAAASAAYLARLPKIGDKLNVEQGIAGVKSVLPTLTSVPIATGKPAIGSANTVEGDTTPAMNVVEGAPSVVRSGNSYTNVNPDGTVRPGLPNTATGPTDAFGNSTAITQYYQQKLAEASQVTGTQPADTSMPDFSGHNNFTRAKMADEYLAGIGARKQAAEQQFQTGELGVQNATVRAAVLGHTLTAQSEANRLAQEKWKEENTPVQAGGRIDFSGGYPMLVPTYMQRQGAIPLAPIAPIAPVGSAPTAPAEHIAYLRTHPDQAANFDLKYGAGAAQKVLGQ